MKKEVIIISTITILMVVAAIFLTILVLEILPLPEEILPQLIIAGVISIVITLAMMKLREEILRRILTSTESEVER